MENTNIAEDAVHGVTDISGVKDAEQLYPDGVAKSVSCAADANEKGAFSEESAVAGAIETEKELENETETSAGKSELEVEFEALIEGKFRDVYRRKTEGIIRKRLKSGKARPDSSSAEAKKTSEQESGAVAAPDTEAGITSSEASVGKNIASTDDKGAALAGSYDAARERNKKRPIENGLNGSCGIVTKINVSALDSDGIMSILRRVGSGEKISFK